MWPNPEIHSQDQINHENTGEWKNNSLLFLFHPNYYNRSSTPYNYYMRFSKTTNFRKNNCFLEKQLNLENSRTTLKLTTN